MIAIQIILVFGFVIFFWWFLSNPTSHQIGAWIKILCFLFTILAIIAVVFPGLSNRIASSLGVTTGANLLLYCLTLAFIFVVINMYIKSKRDERRLALVVRRLAIIEAELKKRGKNG